MYVCVFSGNLTILVNGILTHKISIKRGLKQGDPLTPFLFLLVVDRLSEIFLWLLSWAFSQALDLVRLI